MDYIKYNHLWLTDLTEEQFNEAVSKQPTLPNNYTLQSQLAKKYQGFGTLVKH